jgi:2-phosphosulfolactate phosphatase
MQPKLEVIFSPAELASLSQRDLRQAVCVVFDVLRATTSMITALANGAQAIIPVAEISEALALKQKSPDVLLAGERNGVRIRSDLTGSIDFDLGNSPRDFTAEKVQGRSIVMTTTNGTRWLRENEPAHLILVCSGTFDEPALEDVLAAGALCEKIWSNYAGGHVSDSAEIARRIYPLLQFNLAEAMKHSRNGRRLLANPELRDDVYLCVQRETASFVASLLPSGVVRRLG